MQPRDDLRRRVADQARRHDHGADAARRATARWRWTNRLRPTFRASVSATKESGHRSATCSRTRPVCKPVARFPRGSAAGARAQEPRARSLAQHAAVAGNGSSIASCARHSCTKSGEAAVYGDLDFIALGALDRRGERANASTPSAPSGGSSIRSACEDTALPAAAGRRRARRARCRVAAPRGRQPRTARGAIASSGVRSTIPNCLGHGRRGRTRRASSRPPTICCASRTHVARRLARAERRPGRTETLRLYHRAAGHS